MKLTPGNVLSTVLAAVTLLASGAPLRADFVSFSPVPFADPAQGFGIPGGPTICFATFCAGNNLSHDFQLISDTFTNNDPVLGGPAEIQQLTATFSGTLYANNGGTAGAVLGNYSVSGQPVTFEYINRPSSGATGLWTAYMTQDSLTVDPADGQGHSFSLTLASPAQGTLSVTPIGSLQNDALQGFDGYERATQYDISLNIDQVNADFVVDGTDLGVIPFGLSLQDTSATPEPGTLLLLAAPLGWIAKRSLLRCS